MKVQNLKSANGNKVAIQFEIRDNGKRVFQSYNSVICVIENGVVTLDKNYWDYSQTTGKYRNIFLGEKKKDTERKIKEGIYKLANLN